MKKRNYLIGLLFLGMGILPSTLGAQQPPGTQTTETPEAKKHIDVPAPLGGLTPQLIAPPKGESETVLTGGLGVSAFYENNIASLNGTRSNRYLYTIMPRIGLERFGRETQWVLNYSGGMTFDQNALQDDLITHRATADIRHNFNRRLAAELREEYLVSNSPFASPGTSESLPALTGPGELSAFLVPSIATRSASVSMASLGYQLGAHSGIGVNGNFSVQRFRDVVTTSGVSGGLIDTRTVAGRAFAVSEISARQTIGAEYQIQDLAFAGGLAHAIDHTVYFFDEISLSSDMKLSLFAGPERSHIENVLILNPNLSTSVVAALSDQWSWAGGIMYTWRGKHSGFRAAGRREVSDGGGFLGAVRLTTAQLEISRKFDANWTANLGTSYSDGRALDASANGTGERTTTADGHVGIEYRLARDIIIRGQYAHIYQPHAQIFLQNIRGHRDRVEIGLEYQFHRTLTQ